MICGVFKDGDPLPRNTRFQVQASGELEIKSVRVEDEGFYVCSITYLGTTKYAQALLEVNGIMSRANNNNNKNKHTSLNE